MRTAPWDPLYTMQISKSDSGHFLLKLSGKKRRLRQQNQRLRHSNQRLRQQKHHQCHDDGLKPYQKRQTIKTRACELWFALKSMWFKAHNTKSYRYSYWHLDFVRQNWRAGTLGPKAGPTGPRANFVLRNLDVDKNICMTSPYGPWITYFSAQIIVRMHVF